MLTLGIFHFYEEAEKNPDILTPVLTQDIIDFHFKQGLRPVVIYPEIVAGNPLGAECVIRYVLNFPGLLGGDEAYPETETVVAFSRTLADACENAAAVLHIPVIDENVYHMEYANAPSSEAPITRPSSKTIITKKFLAYRPIWSRSRATKPTRKHPERSLLSCVRAKCSTVSRTRRSQSKRFYADAPPYSCQIRILTDPSRPTNSAPRHFAWGNRTGGNRKSKKYN